MKFKTNMLRRDPTAEEIESLSFPRDKFDLISVNYVDEWDSHKSSIPIDSPDSKVYVYRKKSVHVTVKCRKCGSVKHEVTDRPDMSCKIGPCMPTWVDLTGKTFGNLNVIKLDHSKLLKSGNRQWLWMCKCTCGNVCYKKSSDLVSHYQTMCPKCSRATSVARTTLPDGLSKWHRMLRVYKKNAKLKGHEFLLTDEEFIAVSQNPCAYCGAEPSANAYGVVCNGIDRLDSSDGYVHGNVVACCKHCNIMKNKLSVDSFLEHIKNIYAHSILHSKLNDHPEREYAPSGVEMGISQ